LATIKVIEEKKLLDNARIMGEYIVKRFQEMKDSHPLIGDVRGKGLLLGVDLIRDRRTREPAHKEVLKLCWRCWEKGLIITNLGTSVLRVAPPLNLSTQEADHALRIIEEALIDVEKGKVSDTVLSNMIGW
jgi:4-aminobutyrate aminotransferase